MLDIGGCPQFSHLAVSQLIFIFINTENPIKMLKKPIWLINQSHIINLKQFIKGAHCFNLGYMSITWVAIKLIPYSLIIFCYL